MSSPSSRLTRITLTLMVAVSGPSPVGAQDSSVAPRAGCTTIARSGHAMAYDSQRKTIVLFGGGGAGDSSTADTWEWNGRTWRCLRPAGVRAPKPRNAAMLAYDEARHVLVLYGGRSGRTALRDTWELDASGWRLKDSAGPTPEPHGAMSFDSKSGAVLLYHATADESGERGTWGWNGQTWRRLATGPNDEIPDAIVPASEARATTLLTARPTGDGDSFELLLYTWANDRWRPFATTGERPRFSPQAPAARTPTGALVYAGFEPGGAVRTWFLTDATWQSFGGTSPPRRRGAAMAFDRGRGVVVLHGGDDGSRLLSDTWEWSANAWRRIVP